MEEAPVALVLGGKSGLLGQALMRTAKVRGWSPVSLGREDGDMLDEDWLARQIERRAPQAIFNTIAWTQVDQAEDDPEGAMRVNMGMPLTLARLLKGKPVPLVHYSTDFVFSGRKEAPYTEDDEPDSCAVYGRTKVAGEKALLRADLAQCCIIRTAWLFGPGRKNFISTILDLAGKRGVVSVVHDQTGSPTYTQDLAEASFELLRAKAKGLVHVVNSGQASWCELAEAAVATASLPCRVEPIESADWPQKARRPAYSVLDTHRYTALTGKTMRPWLAALRDYVFSDFLPSAKHTDM